MYRKIGVTEAGDAGLDLSWVSKLFDVNVIITKHLTPKNTALIKALLNNKDKIILHCTCTGYGGTKMEQNVPTPPEVHDGVQHLIRQGFPVEQIVLRTDPIIPTQKGINRVKRVWDLFQDTKIKRCRYSVIDMYPHTKQRILDVYGTVPFNTFKAPKHMMDALKNEVENYGKYEFESCAENLPKQVGCISKKDFDILNVPFKNPKGGFQRSGCLCAAGKTELLNNKKRCPSGCLYCYWKD